MNSGLMAVATVVAVTLTAQGRPDFSGSWVMVSSDGTPAEVPHTVVVVLPRTSVNGKPLAAEHGDIDIQRIYNERTSSATYRVGVRGGMVAGVNADGSKRGPSAHHFCRWVDNTVVLESGTYSGDRPQTGVWEERREEWSLQPSGQLRVTIITRSSSAEPRTVEALYRRR